MDKMRIQLDERDSKSIVTNETIEDMNKEIKGKIKILKDWISNIIYKQNAGLINLNGQANYDKFYYICKFEEHIDFLNDVIEVLLEGIPNADFVQLKEDYENRCIDEHNRSIGDGPEE